MAEENREDKAGDAPLSLETYGLSNLHLAGFSEGSIYGFRYFTLVLMGMGHIQYVASG